jgi:hypothetical protein
MSGSPVDFPDHLQRREMVQRLKSAGLIPRRINLRIAMPARNSTHR